MPPKYQAFRCPTCRKVMLKVKDSLDTWVCVDCRFQWDKHMPMGMALEEVQVDHVEEYTP